jgi:phosphoglycerol transferase
MRQDMAREELPRLPFWRVVARIGRVRGARKEASRRVRRSGRKLLERVWPTRQLRVDFRGPMLGPEVRRVEGLAVPEGWGRWTDGALAVIEFNRPIVDASRITLRIHEAFGPNVGKPLVIRAGGHAHVHLLRRGEQRCSVGLRRELNGGLQRIELEIPEPASPQSLGYNSDPRLLGIGVSELEIAFHPDRRRR